MSGQAFLIGLGSLAVGFFCGYAQALNRAGALLAAANERLQRAREMHVDAREMLALSADIADGKLDGNAAQVAAAMLAAIEAKR